MHRRATGKTETKKRTPTVSRVPSPPAGAPSPMGAHGRPARRRDRRRPRRQRQAGMVDGACREAGIEHCTRHDLRHTAITWAMQRGVRQVARRRGSSGSQLDMIESTYGHHHPDHLQKGVSRRWNGNGAETVESTETGAPKGSEREQNRGLNPGTRGERNPPVETSGGRGRWFESTHSDQRFQAVSGNSPLPNHPGNCYETVTAPEMRGGVRSPVALEQVAGSRGRRELRRNSGLCWHIRPVAWQGGRAKATEYAVRRCNAGLPLTRGRGRFRCGAFSLGDAVTPAVTG